MAQLGISDFRSIANQSAHRAVLLSEDRVSLRRGGLLRTSLTEAKKQENVDVMNVFRSALKDEYGVFGEQAFDHVMSKRSSMKWSLRGSDVRQVLAEATGHARFVSLFSEGARQMAIHPKFARQDLSVSQRESIATTYKNLLERFTSDKPLPASLHDVSANAERWHGLMENAKSVEELSPLAERFLEAAMEMAEWGGAFEAIDYDGTEANRPASVSAAGLGKLGHFSMGRTEGSVEDRVRAGTVGKGLTINPRSLNPYILDSLKDKGVEPGFVAHHDWSMADTRSYMRSIDEQALRQEIRTVLEQSGEIEQDALEEGTLLRQTALGLGERCSAYMALLGEDLIRSALSAEHHELHADMERHLTKAVINTERKLGVRLMQGGRVPNELKEQLISHFQGGQAPAGYVDQATLASLAKEMKLEAFSTVRKAIMSGNGSVDVENPTVKRFQERVIVKLDYNQSDRVSSHGLLRKPLRCTQKQGHLYRAFCLHTVAGTNAGAVSEVLANDLTRLTGVKTQDLSMVRGQYHDGRAKLMLEGKMAEGYKDFDTCLVDGRLVMPKNGQVKDLGSYKAGFVLMGDRDAIGSKGQNKGFIGDTFFAIDPGHSLEHSDIGLNEDFSLKGSGVKKFKNFSVFDDTTRSDKFQGILRIRDMHAQSVDERLFNQYERQFSQDPDKRVRRDALNRIGAMKQEFTLRKLQILDTFASQLRMYDTLNAQFPNTGLADKAIDMEDNLSKLLSNTTMTSTHGQVDLRHMEVKRDKDCVQFRGAISGNGSEVVFESTSKMNDAQLARNLQLLEQMATPSVRVSTGEGGTLIVSFRLSGREDIGNNFDAFSETRIMMSKHLPEMGSRLCANLEKLTSPTRMDSEGRHLVVNDGPGKKSWTMTRLADGRHQLSCDAGGDSQKLMQTIGRFTASHGLEELQMTNGADGKLTITMSDQELQQLYQQLDENAVILHKDH